MHLAISGGYEEERRTSTVSESLQHEAPHGVLCSECGNVNLIKDFDKGKIVYGNCERVIRKEVMDKGPERRALHPRREDEKATRGNTDISISAR
jgi:hypothetical protein